MSLVADEPVTGKLSIEAGELSALRAEPAGQTTGTIATGGKTIQRRQVEVAFDRSALDGVIPGDAREVRSGVALLATMTSATKSATGNTRDVLVPCRLRVRIGADRREAGAVVGGHPGVMRRVDLLPATIDLEAWNYVAPAGDVTVDWTLDVGLVLDPGVTILGDDLKVRFTTIRRDGALARPTRRCFHISSTALHNSSIKSDGSAAKFVDKAVARPGVRTYGSSCPKGPTQTDR